MYKSCLEKCDNLYNNCYYSALGYKNRKKNKLRKPKNRCDKNLIFIFEKHTHNWEYFFFFNKD